jgi:hypothetical protein
VTTNVMKRSKRSTTSITEDKFEKAKLAIILSQYISCMQALYMLTRILEFDLSVTGETMNSNKPASIL